MRGTNMLLLYIIAAVYVAAVNLYAFLLVRTQKKRRDERGARTAAGDAKLLAAALLGGGAGVYAAMFITKFRTDSLLLMILVPVLIVLNLYLFFILFRNGIPALAF